MAETRFHTLPLVGEIAAGGEAYPAGVRDLARRFAELQGMGHAFRGGSAPATQLFWYKGVGYVSCSGKGTSQFDAGSVIAVDVATMTQL